jgi:hypothetical protein
MTEGKTLKIVSVLMLAFIAFALLGETAAAQSMKSAGVINPAAATP